MCGRFTRIVSWAELNEAMQIIPAGAAGRNDAARYNIAPTQQVSFAVEQDGERQVKEGQWWLVPFWAKELSTKYPTFNARGETAHTKPTYRESFKSKRCLVPADGYYEWIKAEDKGKDPFYITLPDRAPFCFAGLWAHNTTLDITSFTILTLPALPATVELHHRMPVILEPSAFDPWLNADTSVEDCRELLDQNLGNDLEYYRVGRDVNSSKSDHASYIKPLTKSDAF